MAAQVFTVDQGAAIPGIRHQIKTLREVIRQEKQSEEYHQLLIGGKKQRGQAGNSHHIAFPRGITSLTAPPQSTASLASTSETVSTSTACQCAKPDQPTHYPLANNPNDPPPSEYSKLLLSRSKLKMTILNLTDSFLARYLSILGRYQPQTLGRSHGLPYLQAQASFRDYQALQDVFDDLGAINDLLMKYTPQCHDRVAVYVYTSAKIKWLKPLYKKLVMRWAAGLSPIVESANDNWDSDLWNDLHATSLDNNTDDANTTLLSPPKELSSPVTEIMWTSGLREWREYVIRKMIRRSAKILFDTVQIMGGENTDLLAPGKYGPYDKAFTELKYAVLMEYRVFFGLNPQIEEPEAQETEQAYQESQKSQESEVVTTKTDVQE